MRCDECAPAKYAHKPRKAIASHLIVAVCSGVCRPVATVKMVLQDRKHQKSVLLKDYVSRFPEVQQARAEARVKIDTALSHYLKEGVVPRGLVHDPCEEDDDEYEYDFTVLGLAGRTDMEIVKPFAAVVAALVTFTNTTEQFISKVRPLNPEYAHLLEGEHQRNDTCLDLPV